MFGVGIGWNREEVRDHGVDPRKRGKVLDQKLPALARLWADEQAEFHGDHGDAWLPESGDVGTYRQERSWLTEQGRPDVPFTAFGAFWIEPGPERDALSRLDAVAERRLR